MKINISDYILRRKHNLKDAIPKAKHLRILHINWPEYDLGEFGYEFSKFVNLKELYLSINHQNPGTLPSEIGQLKTLKKLHILNYPFTKVPDWIFTLHNLENLMLRGHDVNRIPNKISQLKKLKHLRIENSLLTSLPCSIKHLRHLKTLSLIANFNLSSIDLNCLPPNLKWLALSPSAIPQETILQIKKEMPLLKLNKRYCR